MRKSKIDDTTIHQCKMSLLSEWRKDWVRFAQEALGVTLDREQREILRSVQFNRRTSVASGTARGKDFVAACASLCFLYLTPRWRRAPNGKIELVENTKVALTAPTDRQVLNIMMPEISRLFNRAKKRGIELTGRLNAYNIRTENDEWFLTGFKADEHNHEAWSGFHAVHTMFVVTEATGIADDTFNAIEGNLQGDSRMLLVFNPNTTVGYAARSQKSERWERFKLNSLTAPNVVRKENVYPGQVDWEWVNDKVEQWCEPIAPEDARESENDFEFEGGWYRPGDLFRRKVLGEFPKAGEDALIPPLWIEMAQERWRKGHLDSGNDAVIGVDVAGMGRDCTVMCWRYGSRVERFEKRNSGGKADHMATAGRVIDILRSHSGCAVSIDTIGEGAGVYSRIVELCGEGNTGTDPDTVVSCKFSGSARDGNRELRDSTGQREFANMRAYLFWSVREWLDPDGECKAELPPGGSLMEEAAEIKWSYLSNGKIIIEPKEDIRKRLGHSTDEFDALANTFHPKAVAMAGGGARSGAAGEDDMEDILY